MSGTRYHINRMIQDLNGDLAARGAFQADPPATFEKYGISTGEQELLADGSIEAMTRLGVHPNLQMKWLMIRAGSPPPGAAKLAAFLARLTNH
jgi:hypothetical protein